MVKTLQIFTFSLAIQDPAAEMQQSNRRRRAPVSGDEAFASTGVHYAVCRTGLVCKAAEIFLYETFLKVYARVLGGDFIAQFRRKLIKFFSKYIETDTQIESSNFAAHLLRDAGSGVQGNGFPDRLYLLFRDIMCGEELPGGICAIHLKASVLTRECLEESEVVKCSGDVKEFQVEAEFLLAALLSREQVRADGAIDQQMRLSLKADRTRRR